MPTQGFPELTEANAGNGANTPKNEHACHRCNIRPRAGKHRWCLACQRAAKRERRKAKLAQLAATAGNGLDADGAVNVGSEDEVFARANGQIPRRDVTMVYRAVLHDEGPMIYRQIVRGCRRSPRFALDVRERAADRIHGKPKQPVDLTARRPVYFTQAPTPASVQAEAEAVASTVLETALGASQADDEPADARVDLAQLPPGLQAQGYAVVPPPV